MNLSNSLRLRHLEVFVEVARQGSVTRAAEVLGMTQPAASRALRELEAVCTKPLVERDGRGIRLSPFGEMFRDHAGRSLALARDGVAMLQGLDAEEGPRVRIGALPTVSARLVPDTIAKLHKAEGGSRFAVWTGDNQYLMDQLRRGGLDLVVGRMPAPEQMAGVDFTPLFHELIVAVVSARHPLAGQADISSSDFADFPVLMPSEGSIIRPAVERMLLERGLVMPSTAVETVSSTFGRRFVLEHQAIWLISEGVVEPDLAAGRMVKLAVDTTGTLGPVGLCIRSEHQPSAAAMRFCAELRETCRSLLRVA